MTTTTRTKAEKTKPRICRTCKRVWPVGLPDNKDGYRCTVLGKLVNPQMHACHLYPGEGQ